MPPRLTLIILASSHKVLLYLFTIVVFYLFFSFDFLS
ncbi:hypothetical protein C369_06389 [Cryptococcus neoformans A5-35-17]|nr:hypothetical protein C369_06389 [Cryptococcus neoformans var. grubii A5-35-17]